MGYRAALLASIIKRETMHPARTKVANLRWCTSKSPNGDIMGTIVCIADEQAIDTGAPKGS